MAQDVGRVASLNVPLDLPKALVEAQLVGGLVLEFLEDDVLAVGGKHAAAASKISLLFGVLEVDDIVLDEGIVDHVIDVQFEPPGHRHFSLAGEIDEVSNHLVDIGLGALGLDWYPVAVIGLDGLLLDVGASALALVAHADLLEGKISVVKLVPDQDRGIEGDGHIYKLKGTIGHQLEHQTFR